MRYAIIGLLIMWVLPAKAADYQIGDAVPVEVHVTVNNTASISTQVINGALQTTLNGEPMDYTEIVEEDGSVTYLVTGE